MSINNFKGRQLISNSFNRRKDFQIEFCLCSKDFCGFTICIYYSFPNFQLKEAWVTHLQYIDLHLGA